MNKQIDDTDMAILRALSRNARASYREVANEIKAAVGTVQHRIQKLEEKGILCGFQPVINYNRLGYDVDAIVALETPRESHEELDKVLKKNKNVKSIYRTTGDVDMFIRVQFKEPEDLYKFLMNDLNDKIIKRSKTYVVLDKWRSDTKLLE